MNDHILSNTNNVKEGRLALQYLLSRPIAHQPGLGMIYGAPGLGKTQFSQRTAIQQNYVYLSAKKADSAKSFIAELTRLLLLRYYPTSVPYSFGSRSTLFYRCIDMINENTSTASMPVIMVDEVDNIVHEAHEGIVGMLRDIVDNTAAVVLMIGMQDLKNKVLKLNTHYYNRVVYFCEFKPLCHADVKLMSGDLCEIALSADLVKKISQQSKGDARKVIKYLRHYEELGKAHGLSSLSESAAERLLRTLPPPLATSAEAAAAAAASPCQGA